MRLLSIALVVLAGVICAGFGAMSRAVMRLQSATSLEEVGSFLACAAAVVFLIEWYVTLPKRE